MSGWDDSQNDGKQLLQLSRLNVAIYINSQHSRRPSSDHGFADLHDRCISWMQSIDTFFDVFPKFAKVFDFILLLLSQPRRWEDKNEYLFTILLTNSEPWVIETDE